MIRHSQFPTETFISFVYRVGVLKKKHQKYLKRNYLGRIIRRPFSIPQEALLLLLFKLSPAIVNNVILFDVHIKTTCSIDARCKYL